LAGLLLYLLLPLFWALSDGTNVGFWQALRAELGNQKGFLFNTQLRSHALVLLLASILPILIMGIRWPSSFGDTSAAGAALTNLMFRVIHLVFLATCLWVFFYQQFNSRAVGFGVPFLTFYYLGALGVGYFSGYALLVFSEAKSTKNWNRRSAGGDLLDRLMVGLLWIAFIAVPVGLINKNWKTIREGNGPILTELAEHLAAQLPASGALVLSDDPSGLMLLQAQLNRSGSNNKHLLVHSRSLSVPEYHAQLAKRYPQRWPNIAIGVPDGEIVEDAALLLLMMGLGRTNDIYYLHPSFGFYFEHFYPQANGLVYRLTAYPTNQMIPPPLGSAEFAANQSYWTQREPTLKKLQTLVRYDSPDARYVAGYYSRALNSWGVALQRGQHLPEAGVDFKLATELNTNNRPALVNLDFNKVLRSGEARVHETFKSAEEKFGLYRSWEKILYENGPFDHPDICFLLGDILRQQSLYRQSAIEFDRIRRLEPTNVFAKLALANVYLEGHQLDRALETAAEIKAAGGAIGVENELELARLEAAAYFSRTNLDAAQKVLVAAHENHPDRLSALDALVMFYGKSKRFAEALENVDKMLKLDPGNAPALINQATLYFNQTNHTQALAALDRLLQKDPKNVQALLYKVFMHTETKDYPKATADVDRILEFEPDNQEALLYQGVIRIEAKEFEQAMKPLNRLLKLQPNNWKALRNRAIANLHRGKLDEAKADYETLRKNLPRYYIAYYGLAEIAYRLKDAPNAIKYYELYLKYVPNLDSPEMADEKKMVNGRLSELKTGKR
jgi:tetratricopeptide (TPR) repeat protein